MIDPHVHSIHRKEVEAHDNAKHHNEATGRAIFRATCHCNDNHEYISENKIKLAQTFGLKKCLRVLGKKGKNAAYQEMNQIYERATL